MSVWLVQHLQLAAAVQFLLSWDSTLHAAKMAASALALKPCMQCCSASSGMHVPGAHLPSPEMRVPAHSALRHAMPVPACRTGCACWRTACSTPASSTPRRTTPPPWQSPSTGPARWQVLGPCSTACTRTSGRRCICTVSSPPLFLKPAACSELAAWAVLQSACTLLIEGGSMHGTACTHELQLVRFCTFCFGDFIA